MSKPGQGPLVIEAFGFTYSTQEWSDIIGIQRSSLSSAKANKGSWQNAIAFYATNSMNKNYFFDHEEIRQDIIARLPRSGLRELVKAAKNTPCAVFVLKQYAHRDPFKNFGERA